MQAFGDAYRDDNGNIRRQALGALVFGDKSGVLLKKLTDITHPAIHRDILNQIARFREAGYPAVVVEAIGLLDSPICDMTDEVWVITAPREVLLQRVMERDRCDEVSAANRLDSQLTLEQMSKRASRIFYNDSTEEKLRSLLLSAFLEVTA